MTKLLFHITTKNRFLAILIFSLIIGFANGQVATPLNCYKVSSPSLPLGVDISEGTIIHDLTNTTIWIATSSFAGTYSINSADEFHLIFDIAHFAIKTEITAGDGMDFLPIYDGKGVIDMSFATGITSQEVDAPRSQDVCLYVQGKVQNTPNRIINPTDVSGHTIRITAYGNLAKGNLVYVRSSGTVAVADADLVSQMPAIGIVSIAAVDGELATVLLSGFMTYSSWNFTAGDAVYCSINGYPTTTAPSGSGDQVQVIGVVMDINTILFNFDNTLIEIQ